MKTTLEQLTRIIEYADDNAVKFEALADATKVDADRTWFRAKAQAYLDVADHVHQLILFPED